MDSIERAYPNSSHDGFRLTGSTLSLILNDLPVVVDHEVTYSNWVIERCEQIRKQNPALVIIHQSAFCPEEETTANCHDYEPELYDFFECMSGTDSQFLMYTRYAFGNSVIAGITSRNPELNGRIAAFPMTRERSPGTWEPHSFVEPAIQRELKQTVREVLGL